MIILATKLEYQNQPFKVYAIDFRNEGVLCAKEGQKGVTKSKVKRINATIRAGNSASTRRIAANSKTRLSKSTVTGIMRKELHYTLQTRCKKPFLRKTQKSK